jgi:hypothetical protein
MSTLIIKLDEANTDRILDVLGDELERDSIGAYHLLIEDGTPLDPTDGSPHLAPERDEAMLYAAAPDMLDACRMALDDLTQTVNYDEADPQTLATVAALEAAIAKATKP